LVIQVIDRKIKALFEGILWRGLSVIRLSELI
jgi:hypothetical protein